MISNIKLTKFLKKQKKYFLNNDSSKRILSNMFSLFILQGSNYLLPLITVPYSIRTLGAENYGLVAFSMAFIVLFQVLTDYGFNLSATRKISIYKHDKRKVEKIYSTIIVCKIILCIISFIILCSTVLLIEKFRIDFLTYVFAFGTVIGNIFFSIWFFQGIEKMKYITYLNLISRGVYTLLVFILVKSQADYNTLIILNSLVAVINGILSSFIIFYKYHIRFILPAFDQIIEEFIEGWHIFVASLLANILAASGTLILGLFQTKEVVGNFAAIDKILKAINGLLTPITQTLFPYISAKFGTSFDQGVIAIKKVSWFVIPLSLVISILVLISSDEIINILYGPEYINFSVVLECLSIWITLGIINNMIGIQFLVGSGNGGEYSKAFFVATTVTLLLYFSLVPFISFFGIVIGMLVGETLLTLSMLYRIKSNNNMLIREEA